MARSEYTLYKSAGRWRARFFWDDTTGKYLISRDLGVPVEGRWARKSEAEDAAAALLKTLPRPDGYGAKETVADTPLIQFLLDFWTPESEYARRKLSVDKAPLSLEYLKNNRRDIELHVAAYEPFQGISVGKLTRAAIKEWQLWMAEGGASGRKTNIVTQAMRVPIVDAYKNDMLPKNPFLNLPEAHHEEKKKGILTVAEKERLINAPVKNIYHRLAALLGLVCGMRRGEMRGLQWGDIADGIITVRHNYVKEDGMKNPKTKGGKVRENTRQVVVTGDIAAIFETARKLAQGIYVIESLRCHGKPVSAEFFGPALRQELADIGISEDEQKARNLTLHGLRHTWVTLGRMAGVDDLTMAAMAGHGEAMQKRYSHPDQAINFDEARKKLEGKTG